MELVDIDNTIISRRFKCLRTNQVYEVVETKCLGRYSLNAADTVVRLEDGIRKDFARMELKERFSNVEPISEPDYTYFKKRKKNK